MKNEKKYVIPVEVTETEIDEYCKLLVDSVASIFCGSRSHSKDEKKKEHAYDPHMSERTILAKFALWLANRGYVAIDPVWHNYRDRNGELISISEVIDKFYNSLTRGEI